MQDRFGATIEVGCRVRRISDSKLGQLSAERPGLGIIGSEDHQPWHGLVIFDDGTARELTRDDIRVMPEGPQDPDKPDWAFGDPFDDTDPEHYQESERFVAGALSTMPFAASYHPAWCLPIARQALDALSEWEPSE